MLTFIPLSASQHWRLKFTFYFRLTTSPWTILRNCRFWKSRSRRYALEKYSRLQWATEMSSTALMDLSF